MKKTLHNKKGFTLAELLIVVAIIAVLVAIAIPIFNTQLEKAREAVDAANIRAAYAEVMTSALTDSQKSEGNVTYSTTNKTYSMVVDITQKGPDWKSKIDWPKDLTGANQSVKVGGKATITYTPAATGDAVGTVSVDYAEN